jgi:hypothetical protein
LAAERSVIQNPKTSDTMISTAVIQWMSRAVSGYICGNTDFPFRS